MPVFTLHTNVPQDKITEAFLKKTSALVAEVLGKPESYVCVHVEGGKSMTFGGSTAPCGNASVASIGCISPSQNKKSSQALSEHLNKELGIPNNRMYIVFIDLPPKNVGYQGATF
jgi:phenylpyruvate tautomerase